MPLPIWLIDAAKPWLFHTQRTNQVRRGRAKERESELDTYTLCRGHFLRELPANEITPIAATASASVGICIEAAAHMPAAGIEPGQMLPQLLPFGCLWLSLVTPHLISFRFRFCGLWPVFGFAFFFGFSLSLSIFGHLFRTAFAVGKQKARIEADWARGASAWGNICKFDS